MQPSIRTILATTEIFDNFNESQLTLVAALCTPVTYGEGHVLLSENDESDEMYIIGRGGVEVLVNPGTVGAAGDQERMEPVVLTELRQGQVVGEVALVDQGVRSATVTVLEEVVALRIESEPFFELLATKRQIALGVIRILTRRLRRAISEKEA